MAHSTEESDFVAGGNFRVYDTSAGKIGLIVQEDLFFPESARVLTLCDADVIICVFKKVDSSMPQVMLRAGAFSNGVAMALCAEGYACVSDIRGKVILSSGADIIKTKVKIEKDKKTGPYNSLCTAYHCVCSQKFSGL